MVKLPGFTIGRAHPSRTPNTCPSCHGQNTSCPDGCGRDPVTGELNGTRLTRASLIQQDETMTDTEQGLDLIALAKACERATGPDGALERAIDRALYGSIMATDHRYTASLDAAMTLVPEGEGFELLTMHGKPTAFVSAGAAIDWCDGNTVEAATPALALCAAALKARASQQNSDEQEIG